MKNIQFDEAQAIVQRYLDRMNARRGPYWDGSLSPELVLMHDCTQERPYGWVFIFNSRDYRDLGDEQQMILGPGATIVRRDTGEIHQLGSAFPLAHYERGEAPYEIIKIDIADLG